MSYAPPPADNIQFDLTTYTPPASNTVNFAFTPPTTNTLKIALDGVKYILIRVR